MKTDEELRKEIIQNSMDYLGSMLHQMNKTMDEIKAMLAQAGFQSSSEARPISDGLYFECWK